MFILKQVISSPKSLIAETIIVTDFYLFIFSGHESLLIELT